MDMPIRDTPEAGAGSSLCPAGARIPEDPARRFGEESFRRVVEWAPTAMVLVDGQGTIVLVNAQTEQVFGYRREELVGQLVEILVPERFVGAHPSLRKGFQDQSSPRPMGSGRDLYARRRDGSEFPVEIGLNPIGSEGDVMILASIVDITERRRAQERLEGALREKTVLLNEIHHRVKNNLQVIASLLNLQANHTDDPQVRAILGESQDRVKAMALTHELLYERKDFSRIDLGEYLSRLVQLLSSSYRADSRRIAVRCTLPETIQYLDLERAIPCGLIVNELVTNAFKHAFPGERRGTVSITLAGRDDGQISLTVADDGVGLPPDLDLGATKSLGMQLVPLLVDQSGGTLTVERTGGARFILLLHADPSRRVSP